MSTHILPEVAQTCQKVVIINKGKVVAIDTPDALTERLRGSVTMYLQVAGPSTTCSARCRTCRGVVARASSPTHARRHRVFEVDSEKGADVRRELATAVVGGGWGLLELRPMRMSLEDIFLSLTTEERASAEGRTCRTREPDEPAEPDEPGSEVANA